MKVEKLDDKQKQQAVILGVLCVGVFGYGAFSVLSGLAPRPQEPTVVTNTDAKASVKQASAEATGGDAMKPAADKTGAAVAAADGVKPAIPGVQMAQATSGTVSSAIPGVPGLPLTPSATPATPGMFNPDPFRAPAKFTKDDAPAPAPKPKSVMKKQPVIKAVKLPEVPKITASVPAVKPAPVAPDRPSVAVTGVMARDDGQDIALLALGTETRIVQVGDTVANNYKVKKIAADGVLLKNGKDEFFQILGAKPQMASNQGVPGVAPVIPR